MVTLTSVVWSYSFVITRTERIEYCRYVYVTEHTTARGPEKQLIGVIRIARRLNNKLLHVSLYQLCDHLDLLPPLEPYLNIHIE